MTERIKTEGYHCPACGKKPAEFRMMGQKPRWKCNHCGAEGPLITSQDTTPGPKVHKHWTDR